MVIAAVGGLLTLVALVALWPMTGDRLTAFGAALLNVTMSEPGWNATARFDPGQEEGRLLGVVRLDSQGQSFTATADFRLFLSFYLQFGTLLALTAWTPVPWRRRWRAALVGLMALTVVQYFTVWLSLMRPLIDHRASPLDFSPAAQGFVRFIWPALVTRPAMWMGIPVVLWILLTFRRGDLQRMLTPSAQPGADGSTAPPARKGRRPRRS